MEALQRIAATVVHEFSDIPDLEALTRVVLRLLLAALLGALVAGAAFLAGMLLR